MRAAWLVIVVVACGGGQSEPAKPVTNVVAKPPADATVDAAPTGVAGAIATMSSYADRMCVCKDKACAEALSDALTKWAEELSKTMAPDVKISDDEAKQMATITERYAQCMTKVMMQGTGSGSASP